MNLWLRLLHLVATAFWRAPLLPGDVSRLHFRVWPHDLDTSLHMNNGRYRTLMDLGRADVMIRSGLWRAVLRERWTPVVSAAKIRFRRELRLFQRFRLDTRLIAWSESWVVIEHRILTVGPDGREVLAAIALVRAGLYDRKARAFVPVPRLFAAAHLEPPAAAELPPEVQAFLAAEDALKRAA